SDWMRGARSISHHRSPPGAPPRAPGDEAIRRVIEYQATRLHERIADGRADESKTALAQRSAQLVGLQSARRHFAQGCPAVPFRFAADETPDKSIEGAKQPLRLAHRSSVLAACRNFDAIAYDAEVGQHRCRI